jgi:hypothetical protein
VVCCLDCQPRGGFPDQQGLAEANSAKGKSSFDLGFPRPSSLFPSNETHSIPHAQEKLATFILVGCRTDILRSSLHIFSTLYKQQSWIHNMVCHTAAPAFCSSLPTVCSRLHRSIDLTSESILPKRKSLLRNLEQAAGARDLE